MNPLLQKIIDGVTEKVIPDNQDEFNRVVLAGKKIMFDPKTHANMELVKNPQSRKDPIGTISKGITGLMWVMYQQSHQSMKPQVMVYAGIVLMCHAFDFAERGLGIKVTPDIVARTTEALAQAILERLGITPDILQQKILEGKQEIDDYNSGKLSPEDIKAKMQPPQQVDSGLPPPNSSADQQPQGPQP